MAGVAGGIESCCHTFESDERQATGRITSRSGHFVIEFMTLTGTRDAEYDLAAQILGYDGGAMQDKDEHLDVRARAAQKQSSREQDERDLRTGRKSAEQLRLENELLASFAGSTRVDLAASRSLG